MLERLLNDVDDSEAGTAAATARDARRPNVDAQDCERSVTTYRT